MCQQKVKRHFKARRQADTVIGAQMTKPIYYYLSDVEAMLAVSRETVTRLGRAGLIDTCCRVRYHG